MDDAPVSRVTNEIDRTSDSVGTTLGAARCVVFSHVYVADWFVTPQGPRYGVLRRKAARTKDDLVHSALAVSKKLDSPAQEAVLVYFALRQ